MRLINRIFPKQCVSCQETGDYLCKNCKKELKSHPEICPYCHRFSAGYKTCLQCRMNKKNFLDGLIIVFSYQDWIKKLVLKLKYYHRKDTGNFLAERLAIAIQINQNLTFYRSNGLISYVPSHRYRHYFIKGYNQSKVLAENLAKKTGLKFVDLFKKSRGTHSQTSLNRDERLKNLSDVFQLKKGINLNGNETIIIIDDVTTTGTTLNELAKVVRIKWPKIKVWGLVLGRHVG